MHKKSLGLSSVIMAGMLAVSSVSPAAVTAYATETGDATVIAAQEDVAKEQQGIVKRGKEGGSGRGRDCERRLES